ncbi:MAG: hypothetical protein P8L85_08390 [Rubripirellula sp.]|nr:hypothetical protein [Rubripirellula sp.]
MKKTLAMSFGAAIVAFSFANPLPANAQFATIIETQVPERPIPPPPEVRGREHLAQKNPYFGLRSSFRNVREYYSNPVKTIPAHTKRTIIYHGNPYYGQYPAYRYRSPRRNPYGYGWRYRW